MRRICRLIICCYIVLCFGNVGFADTGIVVSAHPLASAAGERVLQQGGNAFDAAIAVSAMLGVVEPAGSGIGGGGFWLLYEKTTDEHIMADARERAPMHAYASMYLDAAGQVIPNLSRHGPMAAGIPGLPALYQDLSDSRGKLPLAHVLQAAIDTAQNGFAVDARYLEGVIYKQEQIRQNAAIAEILLDKGAVPELGWVLKQPDLARTLSTIAQQGAAGFYKGPIAEQMVAEVQKHGGIWTMQDLADYKIIDRQPESFTYKDATIIAASLPSSGGAVLEHSFGILQGFDLPSMGPVMRVHLIVEAWKRAYRQRSLWMGDPDFLTSSRPALDVLEEQKSIPLSQAGRGDERTPAAHKEGTETTHFAVVDQWGNRVAATQSLNFWFGANFVPEGTGVLLNNQMDDFSIKPGVENGYQLIGGAANSVQPGKRMLSSMTPTFVERGDDFAILGTPGGSRIISMVALAILQWLEGHSAADIVAAPRFHHQYHPNEIVYEDNAFDQDVLQGLMGLGHALKPTTRPYGNMQIITYDAGTSSLTGASDPRGIGGGVRVY